MNTTRKHRDVPAEFLPPRPAGGAGYGRDDNFCRLGEVEVRSHLVNRSMHLGRDQGAPQYSDAELRLLIAKIELAVEQAATHAAREVAILKSLLGEKP